MDISLTGKTAVICGSSQGIGLAIAQELAKLGARCILLARNEEALKKAITTLPNTSLPHEFVLADFSNPDTVEKAINAIVAKGTVHILVNNTGGPAAGPIVEASISDFTNAFQQHIVCNHLLTTAVIPGMKREGYGRIINIISTSVKIPLPNLGVSNTIRGAVASWAKTMANELAPFGITVNNVLPGFTKTKRLDSLIEKTASQKNSTPDTVEQNMIQETPMKRFGESREIAAVAAFLASPAASYVTGVNIPVDGGRTGSL